MRLGAHTRHVGQAEVHALDIFAGGHIGLVFGDARDVEKPLLTQLVLRVQKPFLPLRVRGAYGPVERRKEDDTQPVLRFEHGLSCRLVRLRALPALTGGSPYGP